MHPIERLRFVARAGDVPVEPLVREAAGALAAFADDPVELLTACRQLLRRRPGSAPLVWLAARMITGTDPAVEASDAVDRISGDRTAMELAAAIAADSTVLVVGSPDLVSLALMDRPDVETRVVDAAGESFGLVQQLRRAGHQCSDVPDWGVGAAAAGSDLVLVEAEAASVGRVLARAGSRAAAAVGAEAGAPVWLVAGVGRFLPVEMWEPMLESTTRRDPWLHDLEQVPLTLFDRVCGRAGPIPVAEACLEIDCPIAPELFR